MLLRWGGDLTFFYARAPGAARADPGAARAPMILMSIRTSHHFIRH